MLIKFELKDPCMDDISNLVVHGIVNLGTCFREMDKLQDRLNEPI